MIINNILQNTLNKNSSFNVVSTYCENRQFIKFLQHLCGGILLDAENSVYSHIPISLIVCHNRIESLDKSLFLCQYYHAPLLIIDHKERPEFVNVNKIQKPLITNVQVALSNKIAKSWIVEDFHNVLDFNINNDDNIKRWKQILFNLVSSPFKFYPEESNEK